METFCIEPLATGDAIPEKLCRIVNKSLRNTPDQEKLKQLQEKYKCPANVENVQIPKIDGFLWDQLKTSTKSMDFLRQKTIGELNLVLLPVIQALIHLSEDSPEMSQVKECVGDAFKLICHGVNSTNQQRRDTIKKELFPKFKAICGMDHPASATKLFGDNLADESKQLDTSKSIKMTAKSQHHFWRSGRGSCTVNRNSSGTLPHKMNSRGRNPSRRFSNRGRFGRHQRRSVGNRNSGAWANY